MVDTGLLEKNLNDPITQHMRTDFAKLYINQTIEQALHSLRDQPPEGRIIYFYVVDEKEHLKGVVPTRQLLLNPPDRSLGDIMDKEVVTIQSEATVLDACEIFVFHRLLAFPVVDQEQRLMGVVDVYLYTDEIRDIERREGNDELFQLIGVHITDAKQPPPLAAFRIRFPWLLANIAGGIMAAFLAGAYKAELQQVVALALFIPVVLALAESVSIQSVSLALQVLRRKQPTMSAIFRNIRSELMTGLYLGVASGIFIAMVALIWLGQMRVAVCLLGGIAGGVTFAAVIGVAIPNLLRFFHREPQIAAGPIALASTDIITLLIYFTLARTLFA